MDGADRIPERARTPRWRRALRFAAFAAGGAALAVALAAGWKALVSLRFGRHPEIPSEWTTFRYVDWLEHPFVFSQTIGEAEAGLPLHKRPKPRPRSVDPACLPRAAVPEAPETPQAFESFVPAILADPWFFPATTQLVERFAPVGLPCRYDRRYGGPAGRGGSGLWPMFLYQPSWMGGIVDFAVGREPDAVIGDSPTREDLEEAKEWLADSTGDLLADDGSPVLARTLLGYNPLVFHVPADSPVTNLTTAQLRLIFVDRVRTWREAGVDAPGRVYAYERDETDVAQRLAADWLKGTDAWERLSCDAPKRRREWAEIRRDPLHRHHDYGSGRMEPFRARPGAIGFSLMAQAAPFVADGTVRLLAVDGAEPTAENVADGRYPIGRALEFISLPLDNRARGRNLRLLRDYLRSEPGRRLIESAGFLPAPWWAPLPPVRENAACDACAYALEF